MSEFNKTQSRLVPQHGNEDYWKVLSDLIPAKGEIIIYEADGTHNYARFKVGDGGKTLRDLNFASGGNTLEFDGDGNATFTKGLNVDGNTTLNSDVQIGTQKTENGNLTVYGSVELPGKTNQTISGQGNSDNTGNITTTHPMTTKFYFDKSAIQNTEKYDPESKFNENPISDYLGVGSISTGTSHINKYGKRYGTIATGSGAVAIGRGAEAFGRQSLAVGSASRTGPMFNEKLPHYDSDGQQIPTNDNAGKNSIAVGFNNISEGIASVTLGQSNYAKGDNSSVIGYNSRTYSDYGNSFGNSNTIKDGAHHSIAIGNNLASKFQNQLVLGNYNSEDSKASFIIGNGTKTERKNAIEIFSNQININENIHCNLPSVYTREEENFKLEVNE